jgi:hypothetical protein
MRIEQFLDDERRKRESAARDAAAGESRDMREVMVLVGELVKQQTELTMRKGWDVEIVRGPDGLISSLRMTPIDSADGGPKQ